MAPCSPPSSGSHTAEGMVSFLEHRGRVYQLMGYTDPGGWNANAPAAHIVGNGIVDHELGRRRQRLVDVQLVDPPAVVVLVDERSENPEVDHGRPLDRGHEEP